MKPQPFKLLFLCLVLVFNFSCERKSRNTETIPVQEEISNSTSIAETSDMPDIEAADLKIKIYIENSGSMFGYVKGSTQLKDALQNLLVDLKYIYDEENIELYFINSKIHKSPIKSELTEFAEKLSPYSIKIGETGSSNLNNIFKQVTSEIGENSISILLSDFIYSIKGKNSIALLGEQQALTKDVFLTASKKGQDLTTNVYQFFSDFDGTYYDFNNKPDQLQASRPYYFAVIGGQKNVSSFTAKVGALFRNYSGYSNEYLLTGENFSIENYSVLTATLNNGRLKPVRKRGTAIQVREIELEESSRSNDNTEIAIVVDLSDLKITENYKTNRTNYIIENEVFSLKSIGVVNEKEIQFEDGSTIIISPADLLNIDFSPTHVFVFKANDKTIENLNFTLNRNIPNWIFESSLSDDSDLASNTKKQSKTFGLNYLIDGITDAYLQATKKDQYFNINIPIHKEKSSSFGGTAMTVIFVAVLIGLILLIISKSKKRK